MDATLHALGEIALKGLPTFFLLVLLHFYLKAMFFKPLEKVLAERYAATTGAKKAAEEAVARAESKAAEYESAIRNARTEIYKENEVLRKQWRAAQAEQLAAARNQADSAIKVAKAELAGEARTARESLQQEVRRIADGITSTILRGAA